MPSRPAARARRTTILATLACLLPLVVSGLVGGAALGAPAPGALFNDPLGDPAAQRRIADHLVSGIDGVPAGATLRMATWDLRARDQVGALVRAHRRGVTVRVVLDKQNASDDNPNRQVDRLQRALRAAGNPDRPEALRSGLTKCKASCRGRRAGFLHSKFLLLSRSGEAEQVVVSTSANATDEAATAQWNDAFTIVGDPEVYEAFSTVFEELYADRPTRALRRAGTGDATVTFHPVSGADPVLRELARVRCRGARNTGDGRTEVRFAVTSWHGARGLAIGRRLRQLSGEGCDVRGVYAVAGDRVLRDLRRAGAGRVPVRRVVQDLRATRGLDRYLHTKVLTLRGHRAGDRSAAVTLTGSANWTPLSLISDEVALRLTDDATQRRYHRWIEGLYADPPRSRGAAPAIPGDRELR